jgi:hypothetical protein
MPKTFKKVSPRLAALSQPMEIAAMDSGFNIAVLGFISDD